MSDDVLLKNGARIAIASEDGVWLPARIGECWSVDEWPEHLEDQPSDEARREMKAAGVTRIARIELQFFEHAGAEEFYALETNGEWSDFEHVPLRIKVL